MRMIMSAIVITAFILAVPAAVSAEEDAWEIA